MNHLFSEKISFFVQQGFFYPSANIYGGLANSWDYGPLGSLLKENLKKVWRHFFVQKQRSIFLIDSNILTLPQVWAASGHLQHFQDWQVECRQCHKREKLTEQAVEAWSKNTWKCDFCSYDGATEPKPFDLLFQTQQGIVATNKKTLYLRPETAQGIFWNFKNITRSSRTKIPFGVAQIGKAFRNEVTPNNFIFRMREFEQMEIEWFTQLERVETDFEWWIEQINQFLKLLLFSSSDYRWQLHSTDQLAHYAKKTADVEYQFPFGWSELWGLSYRGQYDLAAHEKNSGAELAYFDPASKQKIIPEIIEPSVGVDRLILALLLKAYTIEPTATDKRTVLKLPSFLAPFQVAFLPLTKKQSSLSLQLQNQFADFFMTTFDEAGSIGKRYRRQDAIGTPFCITVDYDTATKQKVTIRHRDTMEQTEVAIDEIVNYLTAVIKTY